ncbi:MAG: M23 family metallopeptidase [Dethiobacter sp.]|jgi:murein DD-endopeptidase MepM/ murein hydrolase activator NlpD|nr:MAG: M23 family metallopeptidase [Dethiobacter sp.]
MSVLKKGKASLLYGLQRLGTMISGLFKPLSSRRAERVEEADLLERNLKGDRHASKESLFNAYSREGLGVFPRRYLLLAGAYLVTVVLLLSLVVLKWGKTPLPELPGVEREMEYGLQGKEAVDEELQPGQGAGEASSGLSVEAGREAQTAGLDGTDQQEAGEEKEAEKDGEGITTVMPVLLPQAASPLPQWELHSPFGSYIMEKLPSGGSLHRLIRGAYFQATPGAPVAALWDGLVVKVGSKGSPYSNSVLLEHEGGHTTFYGYLREVWVEEGSYVSRGENIGLLPHSSPAGASDEAAPREVSSPVPMRTIWKGYGEEEVAMGAERPEAGSEPAEEHSLPVSAFYQGNPLLYLELRLGNSFQDPLKFIPVRN